MRKASRRRLRVPWQPASALYSKASYSFSGDTLFATSGDFNWDGKADLAICDFNTNAVLILLGNGDGTFQSSVSYPLSLTPAVIFVADFNNDGYPDLLVSALQSTALDLLLGNGDGTFHEFPVNLSASGSATVSVADFNGDGSRISHWVSIRARRSYWGTATPRFNPLSCQARNPM